MQASRQARNRQTLTFDKLKSGARRRVIGDWICGHPYGLASEATLHGSAICVNL